MIALSFQSFGLLAIALITRAAIASLSWLSE